MSSSIHSRVATPASDIMFVRECLLGSSSSGGGESGEAIGVRLDGRSIDAYRTFNNSGSSSSGSSDSSENTIHLTRTDDTARCEVHISSSSGGCTRVVAVVRGTVVGMCHTCVSTICHCHGNGVSCIFDCTRPTHPTQHTSFSFPFPFPL